MIVHVGRIVYQAAAARGAEDGLFRQQRLNFWPLPQGQMSLRPILGPMFLGCCAELCTVCGGACGVGRALLCRFDSSGWGLSANLIFSISMTICFFGSGGVE